VRRTQGGLGGIANAPIDLFAPRYGQYAYPAPIVTYDQQQNMTDARGAYLNVQANLLNDHLKLVAGTRFIKSEVSNRTRRRQDAENLAAARAGRTALDTKTLGHSDWDQTKRFGAVYDVTKAVGVFAGYSESYEARTTTNNLGEIFAPGIGEQKEAGVKTGFLDGRITSTVSYYELTQTNNILSYATGTTGPRGETSAAIGQVEAKGWDERGRERDGQLSISPRLLAHQGDHACRRQPHGGGGLDHQQSRDQPISAQRREALRQIHVQGRRGQRPQPQRRLCLHGQREPRRADGPRAFPDGQPFKFHHPVVHRLESRREPLAQGLELRRKAR
jgi:Outer membrane receptor for ferric coprogen and ferric-rhodotorulic acid